MKQRFIFIRSLIRKLMLRRSTAVGLMITLVCFCCIGLSVPQEGNVSGEFLRKWGLAHPYFEKIFSLFQLHHVYTSVSFLTTLSLLWLVLVYALTMVLKSRRYQPNELVSTQGWTIFRSSVIEKKCRDIRVHFVSAAERKGYRVQLSSPTSIRFMKFSFGRWGTFVFHLGLVVVITASILSFLTMRRGFVQVIEGDTFWGTQPNFRTVEYGMFYNSFEPGCDILVDKVCAEYYKKGDLQSLTSTVRIGKLGRIVDNIHLGINEPYDIEGMRIYQSTFTGFTVGLIMLKDGEEIPSWYYLDPGTTPQDNHRCLTELPLTDYDIDINLDGKSLPLFDNVDMKPLIRISLLDRTGNADTKVLRLGDVVTISGTTLKFAEMRPWTGLIFADQRFIPLVFFGFALVLIGLLLIYFFVPREFSVVFLEETDHLIIKAGGAPRKDVAIWSDEFLSIWEVAIERMKVTEKESEYVHL